MSRELVTISSAPATATDLQEFLESANTPSGLSEKEIEDLRRIYGDDIQLKATTKALDQIVSSGFPDGKLAKKKDPKKETFAYNRFGRAYNRFGRAYNRFAR